MPAQLPEMPILKFHLRPGVGAGKGEGAGAGETNWLTDYFRDSGILDGPMLLLV